MQNFNWGVLGPGKIAGKFVEDLKTMPQAKLHAVASRSIERAQAFATKHGAPHAYGNYEDMLNCPDLDVVYIASPHIGHFEHSLLFLKQGIPVLCEKPLAVNSKQVKEMIAAAQSKETFLMEAIWTRFLPATKKVLEIIEAGTIGEVLSIKADFGFKGSFDPQSRLYNNDLAGGSLLDIGIYPAFLALLILGKPREVKAWAHIGSTQVDEECAALLAYPEGKIAQIHSSIRAHSKTEAFIYGTEGVIHLHSRWHETKNLTLLLNGQRPQDFHFNYTERGYKFEIEEVMRALGQEQKESEYLPLSFSLDLIELLDKIRDQTGIHYPSYD